MKTLIDKTSNAYKYRIAPILHSAHRRVNAVSMELDLAYMAFVDHPAYKYCHYDSAPLLRRLPTRERAAAGLIFADVPEGYPSRQLIPLRESYELSGGGLIYHLPSNYGKRSSPHPASLGTISLRHAIISPEKTGLVRDTAGHFSYR